MNQKCRVCGENAAGFHFGTFTCEGCKSFFGRACNSPSSLGDCKNGGHCVVTRKNRTACKACRLRKCRDVGMSKSGSRYGRRSNWFKIHCLLQDGSSTSSSNSIEEANRLFEEIKRAKKKCRFSSIKKGLNIKKDLHASHSSESSQEKNGMQDESRTMSENAKDDSDLRSISDSSSKSESTADTIQISSRHRGLTLGEAVPFLSALSPFYISTDMQGLLVSQAISEQTSPFLTPNAIPNESSVFPNLSFIRNLIFETQLDKAVRANLLSSEQLLNDFALRNSEEKSKNVIPSLTVEKISLPFSLVEKKISNEGPIESIPKAEAFKSFDEDAQRDRANGIQIASKSVISPCQNSLLSKGKRKSNLFNSSHKSKRLKAEESPCTETSDQENESNKMCCSTSLIAEQDSPIDLSTRRGGPSPPSGPLLSCCMTLTTMHSCRSSSPLIKVKTNDIPGNVR